VGHFVPHTDAEIDTMLAFIGLSSLDELFDSIPAALRLGRGLEIAPGMSEPDVLAEMARLAAANRSGADLVCFAGGGAYDHEVPSAVRRLAFRSEFVTAYTPYQPEVAQGVLQALFEYQTLLTRLCGLEVANASLYDGATATVEAVNLAVAATGNQRVWLSRGVNPTWRQVVRTFAAGTGHEIVDVPLADGLTVWPGAGDTGAVVSDAGDASTDAGVDAGGVHLPTCATYCSHDIVQRSDDSLWLYSGLGSAPGELQGGNGPFLATSFDTGGTTVANALLCGVAPDRTVWCGIVGSAPSQILTAAGGPALADATSVSVDPFGAMACAVGASGGVWCWGNGLYGVGQGTTTSSTYALPVLSQSGGTPFAGATKLQADSHHVCALKTDGAVWCWGENTSGALGVGSTQATVSYPTQIPSLTNVVDVVGELNNSCALKADGTVWCWGDNSYGSLGNPAASGSSSVPVQVMAGQDGGAALSGVSSISGNGNGPGIAFWALRDSDHSIWAWGDGYSSSAAPATAGGNPITDAAVLGGGFCFLDQAGVFHELGSGGGVASQAIACPGTGPGQSCVAGGPGLNNCGAASESCCTSLPVATGTYFRTYTNSGDGGTGEADPASVSSFRLDKYLVTLGRFRQFANAVLPPDGGTGWLPGPGAGKHAHLNGGQGLVDVGASTDAQVVYEKGWQSAFDANVAPTDANLTSACDTPAYATWTHAPGTQENLPVNCVNWYEAYAFCIWDGGFLPSEAEWEYAAAGGNEQRQYPWGSTPPGTANQYAIFNCNYPSGSGTCTGVANVAPVGTATLGAGLWGQLDLAGDLSEYELDSYAPFMSPCIDCANLSINATSAWADRGGWFNQVGGQYLPAWRRMYGAGRGISTGIRCARAP